MAKFLAIFTSFHMGEKAMNVEIKQDIHFFKLLERVNHGYARELHNGDAHTIMVCMNILGNRRRGMHKDAVITVRRGYTGDSICTMSRHVLVTTKRLTREIDRYRRQCERIFRHTELNYILPAFIMWESEFGLKNKIPNLLKNLSNRLRNKHKSDKKDIDMLYENYRCRESNG